MTALLRSGGLPAGRLEIHQLLDDIFLVLPGQLGFAGITLLPSAAWQRRTPCSQFSDPLAISGAAAAASAWPRLRPWALRQAQQQAPPPWRQALRISRPARPPRLLP
ncbi:MAG: hypothetical protein WDN04_10685 [Rhodospirillales bacterium]